MIIITGASRGLGAAIYQRLRERQHPVMGVSRSGSADDCGIRQCDVTDPIAVKAFAYDLKRERVAVRGLINVAGVAAMNLAVTTPADVVKKVIETNLIGTIFCCQQIAPLMVRQKTGAIINFSTIAVPLALKGESVYVASKAGVEGFSRVFAREMSDFGITVNCIAPGPIPTDLLRGISDVQIKNIVNMQIIKRQFSKETICDVVELLLDDKSKSLTGQVFNIGGV